MSERYGWVVVGAAFTLMFVGFAAAYAFAAFFSAFQAEFGAARGDVALVFSVAGFFWFLLGAPAGMLADRLGPRLVCGVGVASLAAALWLAGSAESLWMLYATYSLGIGLGVGCVYVPSIAAVQPWFRENRALASGIAVAGIGAGNIVGPLLAAWWIGVYGWRGAYVALAVFTVILGCVAVSVLRRHASLSDQAVSHGVSVREAAATRAFWLLYASLILSCFGLFVPLVHLGPYTQDLGYTQAQGVTLVSLIGVGSLLGRFTVGGLSDRLGHRRSLSLLYAGQGAMLVLWWLSSAWWLLALFALVFGICYGGYVAVLPPFGMDLYGPRALAGILGWLYTGAGIGTLIGPWLAGAAYDALGAYDLPILLAAALSFAAAACVPRHEKQEA